MKRTNRKETNKTRETFLSFLIKQDRYDKMFSNKSSKKKDEQNLKMEYNPVPSPLKSNMINEKFMTTKLFNSVKNIVPESTFVKTFEQKTKYKQSHTAKQVDNLIEIANNLDKSFSGENRANVIISQ